MSIEDMIYVVSYGEHIHRPYHNVLHCKRVFEISKHILQQNNESPSYELMWAAYFHDYNHTGGQHPDPINIEYAINGFKKKYESLRRYDSKFGNIDTKKVIHLIELTQFVNGQFPIEPITLEEQALRDADLSMWALDLDEAVTFTNGLYAEMLIHNRDMSKEQFWSKNVPFLQNAKLYTDYANKYRDMYLVDKLKQIGDIFLKE